MNNIKAIITDVDGVMVGKQEGINFPLPHEKVTQSLKHLSAQGIPIVLCTAKFGPAIKDIAIKSGLNNPHITDGGALIVDWLDNKVIAQHTIDTNIVREYIQACVDKEIYTELYAADAYYIQKSQLCEFTQKRSMVLQAEPLIVDSLLEASAQHEVIKLISFTEGDDDVTMLQNNVQKFGDKLNHIWSQHPFLKPRRVMIVTAPGVSKGHASREVADYLGISFDSILGIGDGESDWSFMQLCGYAATIGEDNCELQELSKSKGEGHYYFASSVDDHGLIEALKYFGLPHP